MGHLCFQAICFAATKRHQLVRFQGSEIGIVGLVYRWNFKTSVNLLLRVFEFPGDNRNSKSADLESLLYIPCFFYKTSLIHCGFFRILLISAFFRNIQVITDYIFQGIVSRVTLLGLWHIDISGCFVYQSAHIQKVPVPVVTDLISLTFIKILHLVRQKICETVIWKHWTKLRCGTYSQIFFRNNRRVLMSSFI